MKIIQTLALVVMTVAITATALAQGTSEHILERAEKDEENRAAYPPHSIGTHRSAPILFGNNGVIGTQAEQAIIYMMPFIPYNDDQLPYQQNQPSVNNLPPVRRDGGLYQHRLGESGRGGH
jgi:hypothetical protein